MGRTTKRERETYRDFADKSGGDFSDIIHDLCHDADEAEKLREAVRKSADIVAQGYWHSDQMDREDAEKFLGAAEAIGAVGMWPDHE